MFADRVVYLIGKYGSCPDCGSDLIGDGEGELEVNDDLFIRSCKCGFEVKIKD